MAYPLPKVPALWVTTRDPNSLRKADGGVASADGDLIRTWRDISGNGNHLTIFQNPLAIPNINGADADVPLKVSGGVRSVNWPSRATQTTQMYRFAPPATLTGTALEQFTRLKCASLPPSTYNRGFNGWSGYFNSYPPMNYTDGAQVIQWRGGHTDRISYTPSAPEKAAMQTWHTMGLVSDAGYKELRINGVSVSSSNANTVFLGGETINLPGPDAPAPQFVLGGSNAKSGVGFYGEISDSIVFTEPLTNPERVQVEALLAALNTAAADFYLYYPTDRTDALPFDVSVYVIGSYTGTITYSDGGAGGSFSPASATLTGEGGLLTTTYTPPSGASGTITLTGTATGLTAHSQAVAFTTPDVTAPTVTARAINAAGSLLTLTTDESVVGTPAGFALSGGHALSGGVVSGNQITFAVSPVVLNAETLTLAYTPGDIQDASANLLAAFSGASVTNGSTVVPDTTPPTLVSAAVAANGTSLTATLSESSVLLDASKVTISGRTLSSVSISGTTLTATVSPTVVVGNTLSLVVAAGAFRDQAGNQVAAGSIGVTNNSTQTADTTPPTVSSVVVAASGAQLTITANEAIQGAVSGFQLSGGHNLSGGALSGNAITFAVSPLVLDTETLTLDYAPGNVADLAANPLASISARAVTNNSTVSPSATTETVPALTPAPTWPLSANADTVLLWQDWDALDILGAPGGGPLSGYLGTSGGALTGSMDIVTLSGARCITPKSGLTNYGTVHAIQFAGFSRSHGLTVELLWAEPTTFALVPNGSEFFGMGETATQQTYRDCDLRFTFNAGRVVATFSHRQGATPLLARTASATGPNVAVAANTLAHIAVTITPAGDMTVWVNGSAGATVSIPEWASIRGFSGPNRDVILGGGDGQDLRMGWRCAALKISSAPRGALAISIPIRPKVTVDFTTPVRTQKTKLGRLHILNGANGSYQPAIPLLRTDKFVTATPAKFGGPDASYPDAGQSGLFSYKWAAVDSFFLAQAAQGVNEIMIGSGGTHQLLGGSIAPVALSATTWSPFGFGFAKEVPTDLDLHAAMRADAWWHLAVELGLNVTWIDWWNEANLQTGTSSGFWLGDRPTLIDLMGRTFKAIKALFPAAQLARPNVVLPKFCGWSDSGWDPYYAYPGRDNRGWGDALTAALVADPQIPCDAVSFHHYSGSLANFAGWRAYFLGRWAQAGLPAPEVQNNETSAINTSTKNTSTGFYPFKAIPALHNGAFASSQTFVQLVAANLHLDVTTWIAATQYTGTWDVENYWDTGGFPRPQMHVATLYHWLGQTLYSATVVGSGGVRALAGRHPDDDGAMVVIGQSLWSPLPATTHVDVVLGPGYAGRTFRPFVVDPDHSSYYEAGPTHAGLETIADVVADSGGVVQVPLHNWGVVGLREVPTVDVTAPLVTGAVIGTDGVTLTVQLTENVDPFAPTGFALSGGHVLSGAARAGNQIAFTVTPAVLGGETVTLDYTPGDVEDVSGNPLAAIVGLSVTNNSTAYNATGVEVTAPSGSVAITTTKQFTAAVVGSGPIPQNVFWSIQNDPGNGSYGTITNQGLFTAGSLPGTYVIVATFTLNTQVFSSYQVVVVPGPPQTNRWARYAVTGDMDAAAPTDDQLAPYKALVEAQLIADNPCIGAAPATTLSGEDLAAWEQWCGLSIGLAFLNSPLGAPYITSLAAGPMTSETVGKVKRTWASGKGVIDILGALRTTVTQARLRISCIRDAAARRAGGRFGLAGRRRTLGEATTVEGMLLGEATETVE